MAVDKIGAGLTDAQISKIKEAVGDETKAGELIDLFNSGEDEGEKGLLDDALLLGFTEDQLAKISETDDTVAGLLDGSLTLKEDGSVEAAEGADKAEGTEKAKDDTALSDKEVSGLEDEVKALKAEIAALDKRIEESKAELEKKEKELAAKKDELDEAKATLEAEKLVLDNLQKEYEKNKDEYDSIQEAIQEATKSLEEDMKEKQQAAINKALAEYNEEEDGSWNNYLQGKLEGVVESSALSSLIDTLSSKETSVLKTLGKLQIDITAQTAKVQSAERNVTNLQTQYDTLNTEVETLKTNIAADEASKDTKSTELGEKTAKLEAARKTVDVKTDAGAYTSKTTPEGEDKLVEDKKLEDLKAMISPEEYALVEEMGVDLFEKLENGEPRYIFAPGANDNKYHIYDMSGKLTSAGDNSLVRLHYGYTEESYKIIACGNGGITPGTWSKLGTCTQDGKQVFYADDCGTVKTYQACYQTWSPLSLDLNGDGVQTSDEIVEFDIDGDGVLDKINNSADGVLVFDKDGDGISGEDGTECFGDGTDLDGDGVKDGYKDGFEALKAFAEREGLINGEDDMVLDENDIKYLEENFGFGIKAGGYTDETRTLTELGITEINLAKTDKTNLEDNFDGKGNQLMTQEGATFVQNGETKEYADIWHRKHDEDAKSIDKAEAGTSDKKTGGSSIAFGNIASLYDSGNAWGQILNSKLELEASKKADKDNKFNIFDVDIQKPEGEDKDKKDKKKIDGNEDVK